MITLVTPRMFYSSIWVFKIAHPFEGKFLEAKAEPSEEGWLGCPTSVIMTSRRSFFVMDLRKGFFDVRKQASTPYPSLNFIEVLVQPSEKIKNMFSSRLHHCFTLHLAQIVSSSRKRPSSCQRSCKSENY